MATATKTLTIERTVLIDTREQTPWFTSTVRGFEFTQRRATLPTGDYSLAGLEASILIERKSLADLTACIGYGRSRFERELARMAEQTREPWLFIEASRDDIEQHAYRARVFPSAVVGSLMAWTQDYGIKVWFAGSAELAARDALRLFKRIENRAVQSVSMPDAADAAPSG